MAKKTTNDGYEELESQIGDLGGTQEEAGMGRLKNYGAIVGGNRSLTEQEEESMNNFLRKSRDDDEKASAAPGQSFDIMQGWTPIDRTRLGIRNNFYPEDWQFRIRPATVAAIKNWSSIDDQNAFTINNVFNEIIKQCVSIHTKNGPLSWNKINSWDRFWFMLMVREYTFVQGEGKIEYNEECPECGHSLTYNLVPDQLYYEFPDEDVLEKHWSKEDRCWYIKPSDYGLDGSMIQLHVPTLGKDDMVLQWAIRENQAGRTPDQTLLKFLPWLIDKDTKDEERAKKIIEKAKKEYNSWDAETFMFMDEVLRNVIVTPKEFLQQVCPNCGEEVHTEVQFPNGAKHLFTVQNRSKKFGSK